MMTGTVDSIQDPHIASDAKTMSRLPDQTVVAAIVREAYPTTRERSKHRAERPGAVQWRVLPAQEWDRVALEEEARNQRPKLPQPRRPSEMPSEAGCTRESALAQHSAEVVVVSTQNSGRNTLPTFTG